MEEQDSILVKVGDSVVTRGRGAQELKVEVLAQNMNIFLGQLERVLEKSPDQVGKFQFDEITVSVEISANGKLILLGTGVEAAAKGALQFKFKRQSG
ncbi:MAG: hypothetical protein ABW208_03785 [Pyrinomonadaceae bacterium]